MSSLPAGWWRRGCFSSKGAGLNMGQRNLMSKFMFSQGHITARGGLRRAERQRTFQKQADWVLHSSLSGCSGTSEETPLFSSGSVDRNTCRDWNLETIPVATRVESYFEGFALLRSLYQHCRDRSAEPSYRPLSASAPLMPCVTEMIQKKTFRGAASEDGLSACSDFLTIKLPCWLMWGPLSSASRTCHWKTSGFL